MDYYQEIPDMLDFIKKAKGPVTGESKELRERCSRQTTDMSFTGGANWSQALQLAESGWTEGAAKSQEFLAILQEVVPPLIRHTELVMEGAPGAFVDIDTFLTGEPEHWVNFETKETPRPVNILICGSFASAAPERVLINRGCALAALVDILEGRGYQVQVDVCYIVQNPAPGAGAVKDYYELKVTMKHSDQPLDLDALVFSTAHPACPRRLAFAIEEGAPVEVRNRLGLTENGAMGYIGDAKESTQVNYELYIPNPILDFRSFKSVQATQDWVTSTLTERGFMDEAAGQSRLTSPQR